ncbi:TetR family transcriptional regulator [Alcanivorax sp. N3-2A]|nr:TetR family transcriptional regulator [Alcanivorax sp. N3-2A]
MGAAPKHRDGIVRAAVTLFRKRGYAATGVNDILAASGAPKGSFYHYFPQGKEQLGEEAVRRASETVISTLRQLSGEVKGSAAVVRAYGRLLGDWMEQSAFSDGCPITTTLLETTPQSPRLSAAGKSAFHGWRGELEALLGADGIAPPHRAGLASLVVSAWEGALIQARVEGHRGPLDDASDYLADLIEHHRSSS